MNLRVGTRLGVYEVQPLEGRGATADVYRALDTRVDRHVALKILSPRETSPGRGLERLRSEARVLAALDHPNIARLYCLEECDGVHALVLELVEGPTLADRIASGPLPVAEALDIARQVAAALESAHDRSIVHRDLKPANIKIRADGTIKVLDFGLAKMIRVGSNHADVCSPTITAEGTAVGTAAYMSPEQARGASVNEQADIWAFGCVVYEMLTGRRAFPGDDIASTFASVLHQEPDWALLPTTVPPTIQAFLRRSLRKDPAERPRHIGDIRLALEGAFNPAENGAAMAKRRAPGFSARLRFTAIAAAIAALVGALGLGWPHSDSEGSTSYVIQPPPGTSLAQLGMDPWPALSPDGHSVAFLASSPTGLGVWMQRLGELVPRQLASTEHRTPPFWSPDGRSIGLAGEDGVKTLAVEPGGVSQVLCTCPAFGGATWGKDGTILYSHDSGLSRIAASGGLTVPITRIAETEGEFSHRFPLFLPDGRHFVYLVRSTKAERRGIYLASLADPTQAKRLVGEDSNAAFAAGPGGRPYLLFVRDMTLIAQPLDVARRELTGTPVVVARRVIPGNTGRFAPFAAGGRALIFRETGAPESRLLWVDRRGVPDDTGVMHPVRSFRTLSLSPDGNRLAVSQTDPRTAAADVWLYDFRRGVSERLTTDPVGAVWPVWTPDGDRVIYASAREGPWKLFWRAVGRPDEGVIYSAPVPMNKYPTDVTKDGRHLLFQEAQDRPNIWLLPLTEDRPAVRLLTGMHARVSSSGRWLAYTSVETGRREIYVTTFPVPGVRWRVSTAGGEDPHWRADGRELFFLDANQTLTAVSVGAGAVFNVHRPQPLFRLRVSDPSVVVGPSYAPAPDGQRFLVNERVQDETPVLTVIENWRPDGD